MKDKRKQKIEQHVTILINNQSVKILNCKLKSGKDGELVLEIATKIPNKALSMTETCFEIDDKEYSIRCSCKWIGELHQPNIKKYYYMVEKMETCNL